MKDWNSALRDAALSGAVSGALTALTAASRGKAETGSAIAPLNAVSHVVWGDKAYRARGMSLRHTLLGLAINTASCMAWAVLYEKLFGERADKGNKLQAVLGAEVVSGIAYVTDYWLMPKRLTPGFEQHLSKKSLGMVFAGLAVGLMATGLLRGRR